jgi:ACS family D-galactonate transporter-like MFS transporter
MSPESAVFDQLDVAIKTSVRWKIFPLMLLLVSINDIDRASLSVDMRIIGREFDIYPALQRIVLSSFFWTYALIQVPGGMLADRTDHASSLELRPQVLSNSAAS